MQVPGGNELIDVQALARPRRMITLSNPGHPRATPGFEESRSLQTEVFFEEYARGYAEATLGLAGGPAARGAAGVLARSPNALTFGSAFGVGLTEGFNAGVPGGPPVFARVPGAPFAINAGLVSGRIAGKAAGFAGRFDPAAFAAAADRILGGFR